MAIENGMVRVRYFGDHETDDLQSEFCFKYSANPPSGSFEPAVGGNAVALAVSVFIQIKNILLNQNLELFSNLFQYFLRNSTNTSVTFVQKLDSMILQLTILHLLYHQLNGLIQHRC